MSNNACRKQNVMYTTYSIQQSKILNNKDDSICDLDTWDDNDLNERFLTAISSPQQVQRKLCCYKEEWEKVIIGVKIPMNAFRLAMKYQGLWFYDYNEPLEGGGYLIWNIKADNRFIRWYRGEWVVVATTLRGNEQEEGSFRLDETLFYGLDLFYTKNKDQCVEVVKNNELDVCAQAPETLFDTGKMVNPTGQTSADASHKVRNNMKHEKHKKWLKKKFPRNKAMILGDIKCGVFGCTWDRKAKLGDHRCKYCGIVVHNMCSSAALTEMLKDDRYNKKESYNFFCSSECFFNLNAFSI